MIITCPACAAPNTQPDDAPNGEPARMQCRACETVWMAPGERRAAVVRRGGDRERRDLFASRPADDGCVKQTLRPPPPTDGFSDLTPARIGVAARNETSVLFTLKGLTGGARVPTPPPEPSLLAETTKVVEDDGVIDLKALSSAPPRPAARSFSPLFGPSEPPPDAFTSDAGVSSDFPPDARARFSSRFSKKSLLGAAGGAALFVLTIVGLSYAFRGEEPAHPTAAAPAPPPPPAVVIPPPAPAPEPTTVASSDGDGAKSPAAGVSNKKGGKGKPGKAAWVRAAKSEATVGVSRPAPAPKAADACGCHGNFDCQIRCVAKGK